MLTTYSDKVGGKVIRTTSRPNYTSRKEAAETAFRIGFETLFEVKPNGDWIDCTEILNNRKLKAA